MLGVLLSLLLLLMAAPTWAATINAASCSSADVTSAIGSASSGDTVSIPAGTCTWSATAVTIPDNKTLILQGAGSGATVITESPTGTALNLGKSGSRVTALGFSEGAINTDGYNFRIDHCALTFATWNGGGINVTPANVNPPPLNSGLIDHNTLTNMRILVGGSNYLLSENNAQNTLWTGALNLGTAEAVYVEDNTITGGSGAVNAIDANSGGRYVFRYNTVDLFYLESHSIQGPENRAVRKWEIYGNNINHSSGLGGYPTWMRGGTGLIFANSRPGSWSNSTMAFDNVRSNTGCAIGNVTDGDGCCAGANQLDGNVGGQSGWLCRDQVGASYDTVLWVDPAGANTQTRAPAYLWANRDGSNAELGVVVVNQTTQIVANRDYYLYTASFDGTAGTGIGTLGSRPGTCTTGVGYWATAQDMTSLTGYVGAGHTTTLTGTLYQCSATNTWTAYFTPYTYPHPLQGATSSTLSGTATLSGSGSVQ